MSAEDRKKPETGFIYVDSNCCTNCGVPPHFAPDVFGWLTFMATVRAYVLLATFLGGAAAHAAEFEPEEGVFAGYEAPAPYHLQLRAALLGTDTYRLCQLVTVPSFKTESAVYLVRVESGGFTVVSRTIKQHLWIRMMKELEKTRKGESYDLGPASQAEALKKFSVAVDTKTADLDEETGKLLLDVCSRVLLRVRYPRRPMGGLDGVTYHASTWIPGAFLSGSAWSPKPGTVPADFVAMEEALRAFAESKDPGARSKAHADVKARAKRLAARVKTPPNAED